MLLEHYVTLWNDNDEDYEKKLKFLDQVWDVLSLSYKNIGGIASMQNKEDLLDPRMMWKLVTKNGKVLAVNIYKVSGGSRKLCAGGTNGTPEGKEAFYKMCREEVKRIERNSWGEVSGSMEGVFLYKLQATPIPAETAANILRDKGKEILNIDKDGFHYTRNIGGKPYEKIMFGNVPEKYRTKNWNDDSKKYRDTYNKYTSEHPEEVERRKNAHRNKT